MKEVPVVIYTEFIKLEAAMKLAGCAETGGDAKQEILSGRVWVNGDVCTARGKKLYPGDLFVYGGISYKVGIHASQ